MKQGIWIVVCVLAAGGCQRTKLAPAPPRTDHYYVNPAGDMASVGRVALLELTNQSSQPELSEMLTAAMADEIGKRNLFSMQKLMRSDSVWQTLNLDNIKVHAFDDLAAVRQATGVDAMLIGVIQRYRSFPHMQVALNMRLIDLRNGKLLWALEDVWDSADKAVENRMQTFFKEHMRTGYEPMDWQILITSPRAFERFVAFEVAQTLPKPGLNNK